LAEDQPLAGSDQPAVPAPPADADENLSLQDHENRFGPNRQQQAQAEPDTKPAETPPAEPDAPDSGTPETADRDERGRFRKAKHHAASHDATPDDLPRINSLTARLRATEAERDALKTRLVTSAPAGTVPSSAPPSSPVDDPEPAQDKYEDFGKYVSDLARWSARQERRTWQTEQAETERQRVAQAEQQQLEDAWRERWRTTKANPKYPDFEEVASADTLIPQGSLIDAWIIQHKAGPELLYHLQKHPDELSDLLSRPLFEQAEGLALLSQRFNGSSTRTLAAATGSAAAHPSPPAPRPPNPVRTGPIRSSDEPPGDEASLADHERFYVPRRRRGA
jgi:hypothetical protein